MKEIIDNNTIIVGDCYIPLIAMDSSSKPKINKETMAQNSTLNQMDLTAIFRTFHPKAAKYTFFLSPHETFCRVDHILGHKSGLNQYKKIEIIPYIFSDHNVMKLEFNHKKKSGKTTNTQMLKNDQLKNEWVSQEIKEEI